MGAPTLPLLTIDCQTPMILSSHIRYGGHMFIYLVHLTSGQSIRVVTSGDPTSHPAFYGRIASVETIGEEGRHLSLL